MDFNKLTEILENGSQQELDNFCLEHNLEIKNDKIFHKQQNIVDKEIEYWDKRQLVKKINLNS